MIQVAIQILMAEGSVFGTMLNCAVLMFMGAGLPQRVCLWFVLVWLSSEELGALCLFLYGLVQNRSLVKLLKQVLDLIGSLGERFQQYTKYE